MSTTDKILIILLFTFLTFSITVLTFNFLEKDVQSELINGFMGLIATELVAMGGIRIFKNKGIQNENKK